MHRAPGSGVWWKFVVASLIALACAPMAAAQHHENALPRGFRPADRPVSVRPRHLHPLDLLHEPRGAGVFHPGLSVDVRVCQGGGRPIVSRGAEAGPELCHLLLGRSVGVGALRERPDDGGARRPRICRDPEGGSRSRTRHASPKEQALIRAMAVRYVERFDPSTRLEQDRAYADAMARVAAAYPDDLDIATLYAEALFLLLPRPGAFAVDEPTVARVLTVLEAALTRDLRHPGACHLYIHMTELTPEPGRAAPCARVSRRRHPGREPHQPHARARLDAHRAMGRRGRGKSARLAIGPEGGQGNGGDDLPGPRSAHADVRRGDGRSARGGAAGGAGVRTAHE